MWCIAAVLLGIVHLLGPAGVQSGRTVTCLSGTGWTCDGEAVSVPHTWNAADACDGPGETVSWSGYGGGNSVGGKGYLKKRAVYQRALPASRPGKRYFLKCDGVSVISDVSVNGRRVGSHIGGFTAFAFEITDFLRNDGESTLELTADNRWNEITQPMAADYSVYGGVYRDVWLIETDPVCIDPVTDGADGVRVFADAESGRVRLEVSVLGGTNEIRHLRVENPKLWSPEEPNLYVHTVVIGQKGSKDAVTVRFGFRTFSFRDGQFCLNGKPRQLRGVNRHQDRAGKGWAVSAADEEEDLRLIREMGADALRTAHYPASRHVYDLCDELGLVAWCEYPNVNRVTFTSAFEENMLRQVREMVVQRGNHASIGQWGLFNELYNGEGWMRPKSARLLALMERARDLVLSLDGSRTVVGVMGEAGMPVLNAVPQEYGLNVYPKWYSSMTMREMLDYLFAMSGRRTFAISEYGVGASVAQHGDPSVAVPAAGMWHPEEYQAYRMHDNLLEMIREPRVWGTYVWAMFDFGADNRTEGDRHGINDKGLVTYDRKVRKDSYYMYQAAWTKTPVLHLVGQRMTSVASEEITVMGFSNVGPVTLLVNGRIVGETTPDEVRTVLWERVPLADGENHVELRAGGRAACANWRCVRKSELPLVRIAVMSDVQGHPSADDSGMRNLERALDVFCELKPDIIVNAGDINDHGNDVEGVRYYKARCDARLGSLPQIACVGNHELEFLSASNRAIRTGLRCIADFNAVFGEDPSRIVHKVCGGCDFIALSCADPRGAVAEEIELLRAELDRAVEREKRLPIFVVTHYHPLGTVNNSDSARADGGLRALLDRYPQVVSLSGHTHNPLQDPRSIWQGSFTAVDTSTLCYGCIERDPPAANQISCLIPYGHEAVGCLFLEVYPNRLTIRRFTVRDRKEIDPEHPWTVDLPYDPARARYGAARAAAVEPPQFGPDPEPTIWYDFGYVYLMFAAAANPADTFGYRIELTDEEGTVRSYFHLSDYYRLPAHRQNRIVFRAPSGALTAARRYTCRICPVGFWGREGRPIEWAFRVRGGYRGRKDAPCGVQE